jgi:hypothetical protein
MANGHGGERTPANPAPVSGPGALSQRTDGGPTSQPPMVASGGAYGDRKAMEGIQSGAPLQGGGGQPPSPQDLIPFGAPTQNPGEPVTAGAALGPGVGPQAAGIASTSDATLDQLAPLVRGFETAANLPSATPEFRDFVAGLKAKLAGR